MLTYCARDGERKKEKMKNRYNDKTYSTVYDWVNKFAQMYDKFYYK